MRNKKKQQKLRKQTHEEALKKRLSGVFTERLKGTLARYGLKAKNAGIVLECPTDKISFKYVRKTINQGR